MLFKLTPKLFISSSFSLNFLNKFFAIFFCSVTAKITEKINTFK